MPNGLAEEEQEARRQSDEWEPLIDQYIRSKEASGLLRDDGFLLKDIAKDVFNIYPEDFDRNMQNRVAKIMRVFGYTAHTMRWGPENVVARVWKKR